jgi:hypothetical protein
MDHKPDFSVYSQLQAAAALAESAPSLHSFNQRIGIVKAMWTACLDGEKAPPMFIHHEHFGSYLLASAAYVEKHNAFCDYINPLIEKEHRGSMHPDKYFELLLGWEEKWDLEHSGAPSLIKNDQTRYDVAYLAALPVPSRRS